MMNEGIKLFRYPKFLYKIKIIRPTVTCITFQSMQQLPTSGKLPCFHSNESPFYSHSFVSQQHKHVVLVKRA